MKVWRCSVLTAMLLFFIAGPALSEPIPPAMTYSTDGLNLSVSWNEVAGATGYRLYYANYPYTGPESIGHFDVGNSTTFSRYLWDGAAYYITVKAYANAEDMTTESAFSNIELFIMGPPNPNWIDNDGDGFHENTGDCNDRNLKVFPGAIEEFCGDGIDQNCDGDDSCSFEFAFPLSAKITSLRGVTKGTILALDNGQAWQVNADYPYDYLSYYTHTQVPAVIHESADRYYISIQGLPQPVGVHYIDYDSVLESKILVFAGIRRDSLIELENGEVWQVNSDFQYNVQTFQNIELLPITIYEVNGKYLMNLLGFYNVVGVHKVSDTVTLN